MTKTKFTQTDIDALSDSPELTDQELAVAKPFAEAFPMLAAKLETIQRLHGDYGGSCVKGRDDPTPWGARVIPERRAPLAVFDASIARGVADVDDGRAKSVAEVFDRLEAKYAAKDRRTE